MIAAYTQAMSQQVYRKNERLCCSHISGPSHNWLGLRLVANPVVDIVVTRLQRTPHSAALKEDMIELAVKRGVDAGNTESSSQWHLAEIAYVSDDSPRYNVYEMLARRIVSAVDAGLIAGESEHNAT